MNILLTGGAGYIGSHAAVALSDAGHDVILLDNFCNSRVSVLSQLQKIVGKRLPCVIGDVRDISLVTKTLREYRISAVMHFAGLKSVGESTESPIEYYSNNVQGTINLLKAMKFVGINSLVFSSSATVYGQPIYLPIDELHPLGATNPYGRSKLQIEEILRDIVASDPSWGVMCLRYFNPVGAHKSGLIGENPAGVPNNLVPYVAQVASKTRSAVYVFGDDYPTPDGTGIRDYIHVMDLVEAHAKALDFVAGNPGWRVFNLGTGRGYSVIEVIKAFEEASTQKIHYQVVPRRQGDIPVCYANCDEAKTTLDWIASRSLNEMCSSAWKFQRLNNADL